MSLARLLKGLFWLCLGCWLVAAGAAAQPRGGQGEAKDHIVARHWVEDPSGQLGLDAVSKLALQPFSGTLSAGFGHSVIWLRLRIDPSVRPPGPLDPERLVLRIRPVYLDEIGVFDPAVSQSRLAVTGDRYHPRDQELQTLDFTVPIDRGQAPRDVWLRLKSTSTRQISVQVLNLTDLDRTQRVQELAFSVYIGMIFLLVIWGLLSWGFSRERLIGAFAVKQLAAWAFALTSLGYLRVFWPAAWPAAWLDGLGSVFSILAVSTAVFFHVLFVGEFDPPRPLAWLHRAALGLLPIKLGLLLADQPVLALQINMTEILLMPLVLLVSVLLARGWRRPVEQRPVLAKSVVVGFYVLLLSVMLLAALPGLALMAGGEVALYIVQVHGLLTAFLILLMLQYRKHVLSRQQQETVLALERSRLQAQQEREVSREQAKLLEMLAHELKTPLATMLMRLDTQASGGPEIARAIREMTGVIDRCIQANQLSDKRFVPEWVACDVAQVVRDAVASCSQPSRVQMDMAPGPMVRTDSQLLFIVISNLLENACKYAREGAPIEVALKVQADDPTQWIVRVSNEPGRAGLPDARQVFQKYYRSPQARRSSGTGLGLYLVWHLVKLLGGRVSYEPDQGRVHFVVCLPAQGAPALA
jgi:signal transduction histidine kinase